MEANNICKFLLYLQLIFFGTLTSVNDHIYTEGSALHNIIVAIKTSFVTNVHHSQQDSLVHLSFNLYVSFN